MTAPNDPVVARRARIARWVALGKRAGYALLLLAMVSFVAAAISGYPRWLVTATVATLVGACIVLPVPIVLGYGVRAAQREEREAAARRHRLAARSGGDPAPGQQ